MGEGRDLAAPEAGLHAEVLSDMMDQLLIALIKRYPDRKMNMPVAELDDTGGVIMAFRLSDDHKSFEFELQDKS